LKIKKLETVLNEAAMLYDSDDEDARKAKLAASIDRITQSLASTKQCKRQESPRQRLIRIFRRAWRQYKNKKAKQRALEIAIAEGRTVKPTDGSSLYEDFINNTILKHSPFHDHKLNKTATANTTATTTTTTITEGQHEDPMESDRISNNNNNNNNNNSSNKVPSRFSLRATRLIRRGSLYRTISVASVVRNRQTKSEFIFHEMEMIKKQVDQNRRWSFSYLEGVRTLNEHENMFDSEHIHHHTNRWGTLAVQQKIPMKSKNSDKSISQRRRLSFPSLEIANWKLETEQQGFL
jgi:hypothetical protein